MDDADEEGRKDKEYIARATVIIIRRLGNDGAKDGDNNKLMTMVMRMMMMMMMGMRRTRIDAEETDAGDE
eukprot:4892411-Pyramimonas_sp.AAC.1